MLDMDSLADRRAQTLNQPVDGWRTAIWDNGFQKLTQSMTDGEVETLVSYCDSAAQLKAIAEFLEKRCAENQGDMPFAVLEAEAKLAGLAPSEWVRRIKIAAP